MTDSLHIVCPACAAVNRLPVARLREQPKCGSCHESLFSGHPVDLTTATFSKHVSRNDIPVLVDFWATWCGPCKMMAPQFVRASATLEPAVRLGKVVTEAERALATQFRISSIPTLVLFRTGQEVARQAGAMSAQDIVRWAQAHA